MTIYSFKIRNIGIDLPEPTQEASEKFDTRLISDMEDISFQRDGYYLLEVVDIE